MAQDDLGMDPSGLYGAGGSLGSLESEASAARTAFIGALTDGSGAVHHAGLRGALDTYLSTWRGAANNLPVSVRNAGTSVQQTAATGVSSDGQAEGDVLATPYGSAGTSPLPFTTRPITAP